MIRSIGAINKSLNVLQKKQENTSNNIANSNTPGYKYQQAMQRAENNHTMVNYTGGAGDSRRILGDWTFGNYVDELNTSFTPGSLQETGDPLDFAITGEGFFVLDTATGERAYTRNGNFVIDPENRLATMEGHRVLGTGLDGLETPIYMDSDGRIQNSARFLIAAFPDTAVLERAGDTLFTDPQNTAVVSNEEPVRGFLELSNVIVADEMVRLIQIAREFEANQKALQVSEDTLSKAVNEVGKV